MFTKLELVEFVWREMNRKKEAAPRLVAQKKIKQRDADLQIEKAQAVYRILSRLDETQLKEIQQ